MIKLGSLCIKTPLMLASGTWGFGEKLKDFFTQEEIRNCIGALVTKGISLMPREGNPPPRLAESPCGLINSIGLENPGIRVFKTELLPKIKNFGVPVIVNLYGEKVEDFLSLCEELNGLVEGVELNISCPNVKKGGISFSADVSVCKGLIEGVRKKWREFLAVKLSPVGDVFNIAELCEEVGVDAIVIANTYPALSVINLKPLKVLKGGLSGPAIKPLTLRLVFEVSKRVKIPIIACGGIISGKDAAEYLACGAKAFQIGTANLIDPEAAKNILKELREIWDMS